ncbi:glycoside hydrolase family 9 protein [Plantibacter sp. Mn2098]|uniref:glycoside hydrolase family 9 protein n=1 Tax=Plantibacter sp. Mn2098 TaxID=3395266 RepID=UPI003BDCE34E
MTRRPLSPLRRAAAVLGVVLAVAVCLSGAGWVGSVVSEPAAGDTVAQPTPPPLVIRVNQLGYGIGDSKSAYVLESAAAASDTDGFRIVDDAGRTVVTAEAGKVTGAWNDRYERVRRIDFTAFDRPGEYRIEHGDGADVVASPRFRIASRDELMQPMLADTVTFFQAQRDGDDVVPTVLDRKPSHLLDHTADVYADPTFSEDGDVLESPLTVTGGPIDVAGGWFDAGDYLKFTGTTAYATMELLLTQRTRADVPGLADESAIGLRWLDRMWDGASRTLYAQVGIGSGNDDVLTDHDVWRLPESDDSRPTSPTASDYAVSHRPVFRANTPGGPISPNLAGRVAAVFAIAAQQESDPAAAKAGFEKAAAVYQLADTAPDGLRTTFPNNFYPEESWQDDLELGAVELSIAARVVGDARADEWQAQAAAWAAAYIASDTVGTLELSDVSAIAHGELIAHGKRSSPALVADLRRQLDSGALAAADDPFSSGVDYGGFDAVPHAFGLVATAAIYERATGDDSYSSMATAQLDWVFGANPWGTSFVIGAGEVFPQCPAHQVANLVDGAVLTGAVVNGPNGEDVFSDIDLMEGMRPCSADAAEGVPWAEFDGNGSRYLDDVGAWQTSEPALDFTSTALLAYGLFAPAP